MHTLGIEGPHRWRVRNTLIRALQTCWRFGMRVAFGLALGFFLEEGAEEKKEIVEKVEREKDKMK